LTVARECAISVLKLKWCFYRLPITNTIFLSLPFHGFYLYFEPHVEPNKILAPSKWIFNSEYTVCHLVAPAIFVSNNVSDHGEANVTRRVGKATAQPQILKHKFNTQFRPLSFTA